MDPIATAFFLLAADRPETAFVQLEGCVEALPHSTNGEQWLDRYGFASRPGGEIDRYPQRIEMRQGGFNSPMYMLADYADGSRMVISFGAGMGILRTRVGTSDEYRVLQLD